MTYEAYYLAAEKAVSCMIEQGATASLKEDRARQSIGIDISIASDRSGELDRIYDGCYELHLADVARSFETSIRPSADDSRESLRQCMVGLGLAQSATPFEDLDRIIEEHSASDDPLQEPLSLCLLDAFRPTVNS